MTPAGWLIPLAGATDPRNCGGKASTLASLLSLGMPVPDGVVLTCRAFEAFAGDPLAAAVDAQLVTLGADADSTALQRVAVAIRELVLTAPLPPGVTSALRDVRVSALSACTLAVRSSAVGEDGASASFAGQFDSVLHVDRAGLEAAVRVCWASYWSARALFYRPVPSDCSDGNGHRHPATGRCRRGRCAVHRKPGSNGRTGRNGYPLVNAPVAPFRVALIALAVVALALAARRRQAFGVLVVVNTLFWVAYKQLKPRLCPDAWCFGVLLFKYPAFVVITGLAVSGSVSSRLAAAATAAYLGASAYELWHDGRVRFGVCS
jgi:hypothetical protein